MIKKKKSYFNFRNGGFVFAGLNDLAKQGREDPV